MGAALANMGVEIDDHDEEDGCSSTASSWAPSVDEDELLVCPREAVIIFDWDDTLMCSSAIKVLKDPDPKDLRQLEEAVELVLRLAMDLGTTTIVTNANLHWVKSTAGLFMPSILPILEHIRVVSARQSYGKRWPGDHSAWKKQAFRDVVKGKHEAGVNLVVLGDSVAEIQAGRTAFKGHAYDGSIVKTVKLKEAPTLQELVGQLKAIGLYLKSLVNEDRSASKQLVKSGNSWSVSECGCSFWESWPTLNT